MGLILINCSQLEKSHIDKNILLNFSISIVQADISLLTGRMRISRVMSVLKFLKHHYQRLPERKLVELLNYIADILFLLEHAPNNSSTPLM
jgi:hypothetical protein